MARAPSYADKPRSQPQGITGLIDRPPLPKAQPRTTPQPWPSGPWPARAARPGLLPPGGAAAVGGSAGQFADEPEPLGPARAGDPRCPAAVAEASHRGRRASPPASRPPSSSRPIPASSSQPGELRAPDLSPVGHLKGVGRSLSARWARPPAATPSARSRPASPRKPQWRSSTTPGRPAPGVGPVGQCSPDRQRPQGRRGRGPSLRPRPGQPAQAGPGAAPVGQRLRRVLPPAGPRRVLPGRLPHPGRRGGWGPPGRCRPLARPRHHGAPAPRLPQSRPPADRIQHRLPHRPQTVLPEQVRGTSQPADHNRRGCGTFRSSARAASRGASECWLLRHCAGRRV